METAAAAIAAALEQVGPRLKRLRQQRDVTLTSLAASTGISKSTLSRLENGQRKPSLRVPLDDLVGAPDVADPRVRLKPHQRKGRTVIPLARHPGGLQTWKIVIPAAKSTPEPRVHEGYEWLYVITGRMRLIIADHDVVLGPGEVAEFDTRIPHWFGSSGDEPAEVLSVFGPQGERMRTRAQPAQARSGPQPSH